MKIRLLPVSLLLACLTQPAWADDDRFTSAEALLGPYQGDWRTVEWASDSDGNRFRFTYQLEPFDKIGSIFKLSIRQQFENGDQRLLWEGYKGIDTVTGSLYYFGFNTGGRSARGIVQAGEDGGLVTLYQGFIPGGQPINVRDDFSPVNEDGQFRARTSIQTKDGWQVVQTDTYEALPSIPER